MDFSGSINININNNNKFKNTIIPHEEEQYLNLIKSVIQKGEYRETRNGITFAIFGYSMRFSLKQGILPLITTKKLAWKTCFKELLWFIRGSTDNTELINQGVNIWNENSSREFLDNRGLTKYPENTLGPIYGHQWRHFNAPYINSNTDYTGQGIDQLDRVIRDLKNPETRTSRRHIISSWNPCQIDEMALPPCHVLMQFYVGSNNKLSCSLYQRSGDVALGVPFNIASYAFLTHILAKHCDLEAEELVYFLGDAHIYEPHLKPIMGQMCKKPLEFPQIYIKNKHENIEDYSLDDIEWITPYQHYDNIAMKMIP